MKMLVASILFTALSWLFQFAVFYLGFYLIEKYFGPEKPEKRDVGFPYSRRRHK